MSMENTLQKTKQPLWSKYTKTVNLDKPLNDYPRPTLERNSWLNLNGRFQYVISSKDEGLPLAFEGEIIVPFCVESTLSGVGKRITPNDKLWYMRLIDIEVPPKDMITLLHFGAIDYDSEIYLNQQFVGKHKGGYLPFYFDVTKFLVNGKNELLIGVSDPTDTGYQERGKQVLSPKGIWYTATTGIWQTAWMETVHKNHLGSLKIITDIDQSKVRIHPVVITEDPITAKVTVYDQKKVIFSNVIKLNEFNDIVIKNQKLWSPENPFLYSILIELTEGEKVIDSVKSYFGMRKISLGKDAAGLPRIFLNNTPYFQAGVLDQGYFPDGLLTPPTDQAMIDDILTMKRLGFNMLRKHIKIEPERWYYHCDRLGMLVWQDMPNGGDHNLGNLVAVALPNIGIRIKDHHHRLFHRKDIKGRQEFETHLRGMVTHLFNHPSIVCWVTFNEGWGQFDAKRIGNDVKKMDPSRLVDHASGWYDQGGKDFISIHKYIFSIKLPKTDSNRPFVLSEFGGYSQVLSNHVWDESSSFGYRMFDTKASLSDAYEMLIRDQVLPLVKSGLCATVYTQLSDVEHEVNGLMTYDRELVKMEEFMVKSMNDQLKKSNE